MKVRCSCCGNYLAKEQMYRTSGMTKACSESCFLELLHTKSSRKQSSSQQRTDGVVPAVVRGAVYKRDAFRCRFCGVRGDNLHIHHIRYRSQGGEHAELNLITLCAEHHAVVHSNKGRYAPLLLGVLWMQYVEHKRLSVPQVERLAP